jgi:glycosyltransferase involved in cell wall biosynthesis
MISVIIPVFRESEYLETLLSQLLEDPFNSKEIIVVADEPSEKTLGTEKAFGGSVKFIINKKRLGKSKALNDAARAACGETMLFIDSDVVLSMGRAASLRR